MAGLRAEKRFSFFLVRLLGGDHRLMGQSGALVVHRYCAASIALLVVTLISIFSVYYGTELLFHFWQFEILLAVFISGLFGCIYIFLITTLSRVTKQSRLFTLSNCIRFGFLAFMAFLISKPIEVFVFSGELDQKVAYHRDTLYQSYANRIQLQVQKEIDAYKTRIDSIQAQQASYFIAERQQELDGLIASLDSLQGTLRQNMELAATRINNSDFLLFRIQEVVQKPWSWVINTIVLLLFFLPGIFIYSIPHDHPYYDYKAEHEKKMVLDAYQKFVEQYRQIFLEKWGVVTDVYTVFTDPPFNTERISKQPALSSDDFIARYLR